MTFAWRAAHIAENALSGSLHLFSSLLQHGTRSLASLLLSLLSSSVDVFSSALLFSFPSSPVVSSLLLSFPLTSSPLFFLSSLWHTLKTVDRFIYILSAVRWIPGRRENPEKDSYIRTRVVSLALTLHNEEEAGSSRAPCSAIL